MDTKKDKICFLFAFFRIKMATSGNIELSYLGYEFFTAIFEKYDRDHDKALSQQELINLFSTHHCKSFLKVMPFKNITF